MKMSELYLVFLNVYANKLASTLVDKNNTLYENLRAYLIDEHGHDTFRDIQRQALKLLWNNND